MSDAQEKKAHTWWYREHRAARPQVFEFGMALARQDVENRIAKQFGLDKLASTAVVSTQKLERLGPLPDESEEPVAETQTTRARRASKKEQEESEGESLVGVMPEESEAVVVSQEIPSKKE